MKNTERLSKLKLQAARLVCFLILDIMRLIDSSCKILTSFGLSQGRARKCGDSLEGHDINFGVVLASKQGLVKSSLLLISPGAATGNLERWEWGRGTSNYSGMTGQWFLFTKQAEDWRKVKANHIKAL